MIHSRQAPGVISPFDGLDVPWLLKMRAEVRRDHPFLIWAPFGAPARKWSYGEFHERVGALRAALSGAGYNVRINAASLEDQAQVRRLLDELNRLEKQAAAYEAAVHSALISRGGMLV